MVKDESFAVDKEKTLFGKLFRMLLSISAIPLAKMIWLKEVSGKNNLPSEGPFIIAANHQSFLDFLLLYSLLANRELTFLAAEKFYDNWATRFVMRYTGQIKIDRFNKSSKNDVIEKGLEAMKNGKILVIFPQGTRSRSGKIEKVFSGVAKFAILSKAPIVPLGIRGAYQTWPPHAKKPKFKKQVSFHFGERIFVEDGVGDSGGDRYREITNKAMRDIGALSNKEYSPE